MPFISNLKKQTHNLLILHSLQVGEKIRVILDCDDNTLAFERNYEFLGVAFRGKFSITRFNKKFHDRKNTVVGDSLDVLYPFSIV